MVVRDMGTRWKQKMAMVPHRIAGVLTCASVVLVLGLPRLCLGTSIVFAAFAEPLVRDGRAYFSHTYGNIVLCYDLKRNALAWRTHVDFPISRLSFSPHDELLAMCTDHLLTLDRRSGRLKKDLPIPGWYARIDPRGRVLVHGEIVKCLDYKTGVALWSFQTPKDSNVDFQIANGIAFMNVTPQQISFDESDAPRMDKGRSELVALRMEDGSEIWRESVPLSHSGFSARFHVSAGQRQILCATDTIVRLLDATTGRIEKRYETETDICGLDWWGGQQLVLCLGNIGSHEKGIRVVNLHDFKTISEFSIEAIEVANAQVLNDMLFLSSL